MLPKFFRWLASDKFEEEIPSRPNVIFGFVIGRDPVGSASLSPVALAGASVTPAAMDADVELLGLYERIMSVLYEKAHEHDGEIIRLAEIWREELKRLSLLRLTGKSSRTEAEDWKLVTDMPESHEHNRLVKLTDPFHVRVIAIGKSGSVAAFLIIGAIGVDVERTRRPHRRLRARSDLLDAFEAREVEHGLERNALQLAHSKQRDSAAAGYKLLGASFAQHPLCAKTMASTPSLRFCVSASR